MERFFIMCRKKVFGSICIALIICVLVFFFIHNKTHKKSDIGFGYNSDIDYTKELFTKKIDFVRGNAQIIVNIMPFDFSKYEALAFFFERFESLIYERGFKKSNISMDWGGDSIFVYIIIKSDGIEILLFRKGFNKALLEFTSAMSLPDPQMILDTIEQNITYK